MLREVFRFELRYQLRQPFFWLVFFILGMMTFGAEVSDGVQVGGAIGNVHRNAPFVILQLLSVMSVIGMLVTTAFVAGSIHRDVEHGTEELFFSTRLGKGSYLFGRFGGAVVASLLVYVGPSLGILIGSFMPWLEQERLGPVRLDAYLYTLGVMVLPNLLLTAALFFGLAALTRSMLSTYIGVVAFLTLWGITGNFLGDIEKETLASIVDPFGLSALSFSTRYWTAVERNSALPELSGLLLGNRLLWIGVAFALLAVTYTLYRPGREGLRLIRRSRRPATPLAEGVVAPEVPASATASRRYDFAAQLTMLRHQVRLEVRSVLKSVPFLVMLFFGVANVLGSGGVIDQIFGTKVYPVTHIMLEMIQGAYLFLLVIIITFYAGELVWRERSLKMAEVHDALPVPDWVPLAGKLMALWSVVVLFAAGGVLSTIAFQLWRGYTAIEPLGYLVGVSVMVVPFLLITILGVFLQVVTSSKFVGYLVMILYLVSGAILGALHLEHNLYQFAGSPQATYSDMNGFGHFLYGKAWFWLYWALFSGLLLIAASLFWHRGTGLTFGDRWRIARDRFRGPLRPLAAALLVGFLAVGGFVFYNTNVLNEYLPSDELEELQAEYEKTYRVHKDLPQPRIKAVRADVDIYPKTRRVDVKGTYSLVNDTAAPIAAIHFSLPPGVETELSLPAHRETLRDDVHDYRILELEEPLAPGATMELAFTAKVVHRGFPNEDNDISFVGNGTFFNNRQVFPTIGYDDNRRLVDRNDRRKHGLEPDVRMAKIDDEAARRNTILARDSDWVDFETTVSTDDDQVALAPGYIEREWTQSGRRYFHYKMDVPILHFFSYLSGRWEVKRDRWNDVAIEIYYHAAHDRNVDRMIDSIKKSLDYFTANFSPYQHRQVRIVEFPRYQRFAQSFPNTIPFSEAIGFIADLRDPEAIDYVFYVTSHEVAHQWWAHQVIGAAVQGGPMLSETLSQYSALMVMEKEYGREKMRRFLKFELDNYLRGRGNELVEETPLMLVEIQPYIYYRKGSVVLYALRDAIGEEAVNRVLAEYIRRVGFQKAPFTTTRELLALFREATPPEQQSLLVDLFETITLFENKASQAKATRQSDGTWKVALEVEAKKLRADGQGVETATELDDWIDVGVFAKAEGEKSADKVLFLEKRRLTEPKATFEIVVDEEPYEAGIDPYNKLVDRNSSDNRKRIEMVDGAAAGR